MNITIDMLRVVLFTCIFQVFVYKIAGNFRINFLENCQNRQVRPATCPKHIVPYQPATHQDWVVKAPSFRVGSAWNNFGQVIGNITFDLRGIRIRMLVLELFVSGKVEDQKCFSVLQHKHVKYLNLNCMRMVPSNFAVIKVKLLQSTSIVMDDTKLIGYQNYSERAVHSFDIGPESCSYYNKNVAVTNARSFTGWKNESQNVFDFRYSDSSINPFAHFTEIVISEVCMDSVSIGYNKTVMLRKHGVVLFDSCKLYCSSGQLLEVIAETCSYCHKNHEDSECFHEVMEWTDQPMTIPRDVCKDCSTNAICIHERCVCKHGYTGNGYQCVVQKKGNFEREAVFLAVFGAFVLTFTILAIIKCITFKKVKCKRLKALFSPHEHIEENGQRTIVHKEQEGLLQLNNQLSTITKTVNKYNKILVLYHPDTNQHKHCVYTLVRQLRGTNYSVFGLPEDYQSNWIHFAENIVETVSDVLVILSHSLCELCVLHIKQHDRNESEEQRWGTLLEQRHRDSVPCIVLEKLEMLFKNRLHGVDLPNVHIVTLQHENEQNSSGVQNDRTIMSSVTNDFIKNYQFLSSKRFGRKVNFISVHVSDLLQNDTAINGLVSKFKSVPDIKR